MVTDSAVRPGVLAPFSVRSFRFQWPADLMTSLAFEMETIILGWYVLVESGSVLWLTAFGALQFHGTLVSPMIGVIGDRLGHRNLLCCMRLIYVTLSTTLMGFVRPSDLSVRAAAVAASVPPSYLVGAMSISRTTFDGARIAGALTGAAVLAPLGMGRAYIVIATCYTLGLILSLQIDKGRHISRGPTTGPWRDLVDGLAYVWQTPRLLAAMWLAFLMNMTTLPMSGALLPFVARGVYQTDQSGLGLLSASFAFGSLLGSIALSIAGARVRLARMMMLTAVVWCAVLIVFAQTQTLGAGLVTIGIAGLLQSLCMVTMAAMLLKTSEERLRGRVMGVRMLAIFSQTFGLMLAGVTIKAYGFGFLGTLYAAGALVCTLWIIVRWQRDLMPSTAVGNTY